MSAAIQEEEKCEQAECRICLMPDALPELVAPCHCTGTLEYAHLSCLKRWVGEQSALVCEICRSPYSEKILPQLEGCIKPRVAAPSPGSEVEPVVVIERSRRCMWTIVALVVPFVIVMLLMIVGTFTGQSWGNTAMQAMAFGLPIIVVIGIVFNAVATTCIRRRESASLEQQQSAAELQSQQAAPSAV